MLAGDSNTRNLYDWELFPKLNSTASSSFHVHDYSKVPKNMPECSGGLHLTTTDGVCDSRWSDRDSIFVFTDHATSATTCIRLSLRFLTNQAITAAADPAGHAHGVARLNLSDWDGVSYPLADVVDDNGQSIVPNPNTPAARQAVKLAAAIKRSSTGTGTGAGAGAGADADAGTGADAGVGAGAGTSGGAGAGRIVPDLLWFSHGLWRLPEEEALDNCHHRFNLEAELLPEWVDNGVNVVWPV